MWPGLRPFSGLFGIPWSDGRSSSVRLPLFVDGAVATSLTTLDDPPRLLAAMGPRPAVALILREVSDAVGRGGLALFVFVWLLGRLRDRRLAFAAFLLVLGTLEALTAGGSPTAWWAVGLPHAFVFGVLILRTDLLALVTAMAVGYVLRFAPLTIDPQAWYFTSAATAVLPILALGAFGAWLAAFRPASASEA